MIKTHQTLLVVSLSFALAACGSSSSGGSSSSDMGSLGTSKYRTIQSSDKADTYKITADESHSAFMKSIKIERGDDGRYDLVSSYDPGTPLEIRGGISYGYTSIGYLGLPGTEETPLLVVTGRFPTNTGYIDEQVEAESSVRYEGTALVDNGAESGEQDVSVNVNVDVDFGNKELTGDIDGFGDIRADITGNTFKGSHVVHMEEEGKVTTYTEGGFYGDVANVLAGFAVQHTEIGDESSDSRAVFQASKVPQ